MKKFGKKSLSVFLSILMVLSSCVVAFTGMTLTASAADIGDNKAAATTPANITFVVPEQIYLCQDAMSWTNEVHDPFQYFVNNTSSGGTTQSSTDKFGYIYINVPSGATNVRLGVNRPLADSSLVTETSNSSWFVTTKYGTTTNRVSGTGDFSHNIAAGSLQTVTINGMYANETNSTLLPSDQQSCSPPLSATTRGCYLRWVLTYTDPADHLTKKAYAYTYVYKPYTVPTATWSYAKNTNKDDQYAAHIIWYAGLHDINSYGYHTKPNGNEYSYTAPYAGDGDNNRYGFAGLIGEYQNNSVCDNSSIVSTNGKMRMDGCDLDYGNNRYVSLADRSRTSASMKTNYSEIEADDLNRNDTSYRYNVNNLYGYWYSYNPSYKEELGVWAHSPIQGKITVDASRYSNFNNIPNLSAGLVVTSREGNSFDGSKWSISASTTSNDRGFDSASDYWRDKDDIGTRYGYAYNNGRLSWNGGSSWESGFNNKMQEGVRFAGPMSVSVNSASTSSSSKQWISLRGMFGWTQNNDECMTMSEQMLDVTLVNKSTLRTAVNNAIKQFGKLGVNGVDSSGKITSCYFGTNSGYKWSTFANAYKNAVYYLTTLNENVNFNSYANALNNALKALCSSYAPNVGNHGKSVPARQYFPLIDVNSQASAAANVAASKQVDISGLADATMNDGYDFAGWSLNKNATSGVKGSGAKITFGYNNTLYAIGTARNYTLTFNKNCNDSSATVSANKAVTYDVAVSSATKGSRTGYTFAGYFDAASGGNMVFKADGTYNGSVWNRFGTKANNSTITLYAHWTANSYKAKFNTNGGSAIADLGVTFDSNVGKSTNSVKTGYDFQGYYDTNSNNNGSGNLFFDKTGAYKDPTHSNTTAWKFASDKTFYAKWTAKTHTIAFAKGTGQNDTSTRVGANIPVTYNVAVPKATPGTRDGYTFGGYYNGSTQIFDKDGYYKVRADKLWLLNGNTGTTYTYTANWTANPYLITLDPQGATTAGTEKITATFDSVVPNIPTAPTKKGYTFAGYYSQPNGGGDMYYSNALVGLKVYKTVGPMTLYAKWNDDPVTVTYNFNNGTGTSVVRTVLRDHCLNASDIPSPTKAADNTFTYTFNGWAVDYSTVPVDSNKTLTASYTPHYIDYTVKFNNDGGVGGQTADVNAHFGVAMPGISATAPTKTGYTFGGYADASGKVYYDKNMASACTWDKTASQTTLKAIWNEDPVTVTYNFNNGTGTSVVRTVLRGYCLNASDIPSPTKDADNKFTYTFNGWAVDYSTVPVDSNKTLTASYTSHYIDYTVKFNNDGGVGGQTADVIAHFDVAMPAISATAPTKTGYTFGGYADASGTLYYNADMSSAINWDKTADTTTLTAVWNEDRVSVNFYDEDGATLLDTKTPLRGYTVDTTTVATPTKTDSTGTYIYTFDGWTLLDGTPFNSATVVTANVTSVKATYRSEFINYTITLDKQEGTGGTDSVSNVHKTQAFADIVPPTREHYTFAGYYEDASCTGRQYYSSDGSAIGTWDKGNATLYAKWYTNPVIIFNNVDGTEIFNKEIGYGDNFTEVPSDPTFAADENAHYTFRAWTLNGSDMTAADLTNVTSSKTFVAAYDEHPHVWSFVSITFADNGQTAAGTFECNVCGEHHETTVDAVVTSQIFDPETCTTDGTTRYTATATYGTATGTAFTDRTDRGMLGHLWGAPEYTFNTTSTPPTVTAHFVCGRDETHTHDETANLTGRKTKDPTCTENGETTYTATVEFNGNTYTPTTTVADIEMLHHDWKFVGITFDINDDPTLTTATAHYKCKNDSSHVHDFDVHVDYDVTDAKCEEDGKVEYTAHSEYDGVPGDGFAEKILKKFGHNYTYTTTDFTIDHENPANTTATVTYTCQNDKSHVVTVDAVVSYTIDPTTCETDGAVHYTATADYKGIPGGDTATDTLKAFGHKWKFVNMVFDENDDPDLTTARAYYECDHDPSHHKHDVAANVTYEKTDAKCTENGQIVYTATATYEKVPGDGTDTVILPMTGHDWQFTKMNYTIDKENPDRTTATALFTCQHDEEHTHSEPATLTHITHDPDCTNEGYTKYTAHATYVSADGTFDADDDETVILDALGHAWGEPTFTFAANGKSATVEFVCARNGSHKATPEVGVTGEKTTEPKCLENGVTTYTASVEFGGKTYTKSETRDDIEKLGHAWGEPTISFNDDYSVATAHFVCTRDNVHTDEASANTTSQVTTQPKCEQKGKTTYTATIRFAEKEYPVEVTVENVPATGHDFSGDWIVTKEPTCAEEGSEYKKCKNDETHIETQAIPATGNHVDSDGDKHCDTCDELMFIDKKDCGCICHQIYNSKFAKIIYKISLVFWRLFRIKRVCDCGEWHYFDGGLNYHP